MKIYPYLLYPYPASTLFVFSSIMAPITMGFVAIPPKSQAFMITIWLESIACHVSVPAPI